MLDSTWAAAMASAAGGAAVAPLLARWVLSAPDRADASWWRTRETPSRGLLAGTAAAAATGCGLAGAGAGWSTALPAFWLLGAMCAVLSVIDLRTHRLPDRLTAPTAAGVSALLAGAALLGGLGAGSAGIGDLLRALAAAAAVFAAMCLLRLAAPAGLGFGDVKLAAVLGLGLGWQGWGAAPAGVLAGFAVGAAAALVLLAAGRATLRTAVPFGPALALGALLVIAAAGRP